MSVTIKNTKNNKGYKRPPIDPNMESLENEPFFRKKLERAIEIINRVGLPDEQKK